MNLLELNCRGKSAIERKEEKKKKRQSEKKDKKQKETEERKEKREIDGKLYSRVWTCFGKKKW